MTPPLPVNIENFGQFYWKKLVHFVVAFGVSFCLEKKTIKGKQIEKKVIKKLRREQSFFEGMGLCKTGNKCQF